MNEFVHALLNPDISFLRYAFFAGLLGSIAFGIVGTYVVVRRISYIAGAISHAVLAGIGAALYLREAVGLSWVQPMYGAVAAALLSAMIIGMVSMYGEEREDTVIGAIWATGMAVGLLLIARTPGYIDPMSYLFGNILLISRHDLWVVAGLDVLIIAVSAVFYNQFLAVSFDEEFAWVRGLRVKVYYLLLLGLIALTVVLMVRVVGIVMVIALLTLPPAVAAMFAGSLRQIMVLGSLLCMFFTAVGLGTSYVYDLPSGPTIIILAGGVYLVSAVGRRLWQRFMRSELHDNRVSEGG